MLDSVDFKSAWSGLQQNRARLIIILPKLKVRAQEVSLTFSHHSDPKYFLQITEVVQFFITHICTHYAIQFFTIVLLLSAEMLN